MRISGLTFLGKSPELDSEFNRMLLGLPPETHINESPLPILAVDESIEDQEPQDIKGSSSHQVEVPTRKLNGESH